MIYILIIIYNNFKINIFLWINIIKLKLLIIIIFLKFINLLSINKIIFFYIYFNILIL